MKRYKILSLLTALVAMMFFASCGPDDVSFSFNATMEQLSADSDAKVHLVNENWVYWDVDDHISLSSNKSSSSMEEAYLVNFGGEDYSDFNGVFVCDLLEGSDKFLGLFPYSANNVGTPTDQNGNFTVMIDIPTTQPVNSDITFSRNVYPMVAWFGGEWPYNLDFHSLAGIVRVQLFASEAKTISNLTFTEVSDSPKQLTGMFNVVDYKTFDPHLTTSSGGYTITLDCGDGRAIGPNDLLSFYLVLPAMGGMSTTTTYKLQMTANTTDSKTCTATFTVPLRRNGITYLNALQISNWTSGTASQAIVGNGTEDRPFKIYTAKDLMYVRDRFAASSPAVINGQTVTEDTYFRIMRSDIVLSNNSGDAEHYWESGISNFVGHMTYFAESNSDGITNNSRYPIFKSIASGGHVSGVNVRRAGNATQSTSAVPDLTPFCTTNNGTIEGCRVIGIDGATLSFSGGSMAGVCLTNNGTIKSSGSVASMSVTGGSLGCVCLTNNGTIEGCYVASPATATSSTNGVGGIVFTNASAGIVKDCYFDVLVSSSSLAWGGIVYTNAGTVEHCYVSSNATIRTTSSVGGIVNTNTGGTVNYCWCNASLRGSEVGGIAATVSGGTLKNCYVNSNLVTVSLTTTSGHAGGLVGTISGGSLLNSFARYDHVQHIETSGTVGGLVGNITGGTLNNCYAYEISQSARKFYGAMTSGTLTSCYLVDGTQDDVTTVESSALTESTSTNTLYTSLSGNVPSDCQAWTLSGSIPVLEAYTVTP